MHRETTSGAREVFIVHRDRPPFSLHREHSRCMTCTIKLPRIFNGTSPGGKQHRDETVTKLLHDLDCLSETLHFSSSSTDHVQPALKKKTTSLKRQKITPDKKIQTLHLRKISKQERTEASPGTRTKLSHLGVARKHRDARIEQFATTNNNKKNSKIESRQETRAIDTY